MFRNTISFANIVNGTGSLVLTDDLEIYNRIGMGLSSEGAEWLQIGRGYQSDLPDAARRPPRHELDQRGLHPQHVRRLAGLHERRPRQQKRARARRPERRWRKSKTARSRRIAAPSRRRVTPPRGRARRVPTAALDLHRCEQFLLHEARLLDEAQVRRLARAVHRRRLVLGAERARPGQSARHGVADLRRPAAAGDAGAAAGEPAHVFAGAALAHEPHRRQRRRSRTPRAAPPRCARNS